MTRGAGLGEHLERYVSALIQSGRYASRSDILREGVRLVEEREKRLASLDSAVSVPNVSAAAAPALVAVERVEKTFGNKRALADATFAVPAGQICGLLGPNGAGKTTLLLPLHG